MQETSTSNHLVVFRYGVVLAVLLAIFAVGLLGTWYYPCGVAGGMALGGSGETTGETRSGVVFVHLESL